MTKLPIPYIQLVRKKGHAHYYFRRGDQRAPLPGEPHSPAFAAAYQAALRGPCQSGPAPPRSMAALAASWYRSHSFTRLAPQSQRTYRRLLERFLSAYGSLLVAGIRPKHLHRILDNGKNTPAQANALLNVLRRLLQHGFQLGWIEENPAKHVEKLAYAKTPHATWTEEHIAAFEARWPLGTHARLALALLLYTGQRRSDVVTMGPQHVRHGAVEVAQRKTGKRLSIPLHGELRAAMEAHEGGHLAFLTTEQGAPFTAGGFYNWFQDCARKAGLPPGLSPHGLRKATACRLAHARCTRHEIAAITGLSLKMVEHYTKEVNQKQLAEAAVPRLGRPKREPQ